jgi:hypothetical protein
VTSPLTPQQKAEARRVANREFAIGPAFVVGLPTMMVAVDGVMTGTLGEAVNRGEVLSVALFGYCTVLVIVRLVSDGVKNDVSWFTGFYAIALGLLVLTTVAFVLVRRVAGIDDRWAVVFSWSLWLGALALGWIGCYLAALSESGNSNSSRKRK